MFSPAADAAPGSSSSFAALFSDPMGRGPVGRGLARLGRKPRLETYDPRTVLILSCRHQLWQRYGADGVFAIERAVGDLIDGMAQRGLMGVLVYADDSPILTRLGLLPADTHHAESVARLVRALGDRLEHLESSPRYVLILGDGGVVPFGRFANPSPDDDAVVFSDDVYAADMAATGVAEGHLSPTRAVGRIPDAHGSLELLLGALRMAAAAHRRLAAGERLHLADDGWGYSASVWRRAARGAFAAVGEPKGLRLSPPLTHQEAPQLGQGGPRFRYFNLHGLVDSPNWFGQRDPSFPADYPNFPIALRPGDLAAAPGSVIFSAACYGAHLEGRRAQDSIALTALAGGSLAFVGATGVAYGGLEGPLVAADLLAFRFWEALRKGAPAGLALAHAKRSLATEALRRQGYLDAEDEKTAMNFVLYGDPSLVHQVPAAWAEHAASTVGAGDAIQRVGSVDLVGTLSVRPRTAATAPGGLATAQLAEHVRRAVARRLPTLASGEAEVDLVPAGGSACFAKAAADSGIGVDRGAVVTFTKSLCTGHGSNCHEVLRVTVDSSGHIRKLTLSR